MTNSIQQKRQATVSTIKFYTCKIKSRCGEVEIYLFKNQTGKPCAAAFVGSKKTKFTWCYQYSSEAKRLERINSELKEAQRRIAVRAQREASAVEERTKLAASLKVGDIIVKTWGYSMTIVDFAVIMKISGSKYTVNEISNTLATGENLSGKLQGDWVVPGEITDKVFDLRLRTYSLGDGWRLWDGKPCYENRND